MRDYVLMTDSCCDLTDYMARELEIGRASCRERV